MTVNLLLPPFHLRQVEVRGDIESDIHNHVLRHRVKVRSLRHDHVPARRQFRQDVTAVGAGDCLASQAGSVALGCYLCPRHHAAARIHNVTANRPTIALSQKIPTRHKQQSQCDQHLRFCIPIGRK